MSNRDQLGHLFVLADRHGADSGESDHTVGDLQDLLRAAFRIFTPAQKKRFFASDEVAALKEVAE